MAAATKDTPNQKAPIPRLLAKYQSEILPALGKKFGRENMLMASDTLPSMGHRLTVGNNFYINLAPESGEEAERLFKGLSAGGSVDMALQPTPWAEGFASFTDRFGVQWMVTYTGKVQFTPGH